jgi:hypothetical protein
LQVLHVGSSLIIMDFDKLRNPLMDVLTGSSNPDNLPAGAFRLKFNSLSKVAIERGS